MTEQANCFGGRVDGRLRGGWVGKFDALEMIGDVGRGGVDAVEGIEKAHGRTGAGIGRCGDSSMLLLARPMLLAASGGRVT